MKKTKSIIAIILCMWTLLSTTCVSVSAANYTTNFVRYSAPANSGDYAYWHASSKKVVKSSSTTTNEIRWMQAALNYCRAYEGLSFKSTLDVDGSFGPASKEATIAFQRAVNVAINNRVLNISKLTVDGSFGPATIIAMKKVLNDSYKTFSVVIPTRTTSTTTSSTTTTSTAAVSFTQQNILQVNANSSTKYISGSWYKLKNGNCTCGSCGNLGYGDHEYIQGGGCGIVSLVSAIYNLGGTIDKNNIYDAIDTVFDWAYSKGYWKNQTYWSLFTSSDDKFGNTYGFTVSKQYGSKESKVSLDSLVSHLKNGGTAVVHVEGHFMAAVSYKMEDGVEKIWIFDPAPGKGSLYNSDKRSGITSAEGSWISLANLKNDGGTKGGKASYENIEIDAYWLISKK